MSKLNYSAVVGILLKGIRASGLALDVVDPLVFHPMPHFVRPVHVFGVGGATHMHGTPIPGPDAVLQHSCTLSQSFFTWGSGAFEKGVVRPDSLYSKLFAALGLPRLDWHPITEIALDYFPSQPGSLF